MLADVLGEHHRLASGAHQFVNHPHDGGRVLFFQRIGEAEQEAAVARTQHIAHEIFRHLIGIAQAHVQYRQRVAHSALCGAGDEHQRVLRRFRLRALRRLTQPPRDLVRRNPPEVEALAAAENRRGQLLRLGRREDENDVRRRLLQRFQQGIKRGSGQHVHFVDDVDLVFPLLRRIFDRLAQIADFLDAIVARRVDFHHVHRLVRQQTAAGFALPAWIAVHGVLTVDGAREDFRGGCLARAAAAAEEVRMGDAPAHHLIAQRGDDRLLRHHAGKVFGSPLAVECLICHNFYFYSLQYAIIAEDFASADARRGQRKQTNVCARPLHPFGAAACLGSSNHFKSFA